MDVADLVPVARAFARPIELFQRYVSDQTDGSRDVLLTVRHDEPVGYVTLNWRSAYPPFAAESIPEIQDLNVIASHRRQGIGSALLTAAEERAAQTVRVVGIRVGLDAGYGSAQRLYIRRGYLPDGRGLVYQERFAEYGQRIVVDDDALLCFTKTLP